jgi:hypothetical protein
MESNDKCEESLPEYSSFSSLTFQDPFASVEGGVGSLRINTATKRIHAPSNADSTISIQCFNSDRDTDSTAASSRTSVTSPLSPISRETSPSKPSALRDYEEDAIVPPTSSPPRDNDFVFPSQQFGPLDAGPSPESPASSDSTESVDPDLTPRPTSRNCDSERNASLDGGADCLLKSHGKTPRLCKYQFPQ